MTWVRPPVTDVNGEEGPSVTLEAGDIPSSGPSDVQADLDALSAAVGGLVMIDSVATLEAKFQNVAGVHTIDKQTLWVSPLGTPFVLPVGRTIVVVDPGTIAAVGAGKVTIIGDAPTPLLSGELVLFGVSVLNNGAGDDIGVSSPGGRVVLLDVVFLLGQSAGTIANVLGGGVFNVGLSPASAGATGLVIDGVNGIHLWRDCLAIAPGTDPYIGWSIVSTAVITVDFRMQLTLFVGALTTDAVLRVDPAATLVTGALPTNKVGFEIVSNSVKTGSQLFDSTGLDHTDIRILSAGNTGGPTSGFIGDAKGETTVTPAPVPISQAYLAAGTWEVVPSDNGPAAPPDDVTLTLTTPLSQRHSVQITSRQVWSLRYDGPEDGRQSAVSWKASADRPGGAAAVVDAQLEFNNGGGWTALPDTRDTITLLSGAPQEMSGRAFLSVTDAGFSIRLVSRTDTQPTITDWHSIQISKGI